MLHSFSMKPDLTRSKYFPVALGFCFQVHRPYPKFSGFPKNRNKQKTAMCFLLAFEELFWYSLIHNAGYNKFVKTFNMYSPMQIGSSLHFCPLGMLKTPTSSLFQSQKDHFT